MDNVNPTDVISLAAISAPDHFAQILITLCFLYMFWQSWLQYKTKGRHDVEIENLKVRLDKYDENVKRIFDKLDEITHEVVRIGAHTK